MRKGIGAVQAAAMLLIGILAGQKGIFPLWLCVVLLCIGAAGGAFFYHRSRNLELDQRPVRLMRAFVYLAILSMGLCRSALFLLRDQNRPAGSIGNFTAAESVSFTGSLISPPVTTSSRTTLRIQVDSVQSETNEPTSGKLLAVFYRPVSTEFHYGDRVRISGKVILPADSDSGFSFRDYLARSGITAQMNNPQIEILPGFSGWKSLAAIYRLRSILVERVFQLFPEPENALMAGILLGDESKITTEVDHDFQKSGTSHIIAISGANFTVLTWLLLSILRRLLPQYWAPTLMLPFIVFYTILVGANAAVVRAAIMCFLYILGSIRGRSGNGVINLALTSAVMALYKPQILFDLGFQLSVTATLGILLFSRPLCNAFRALLAKLFPGMSEGTLSRVTETMNDLCFMSVSAQVFTVWVSAQAFGKISLISLPANFLIAPFQPLIMLGGFASLILSFIFYPLGAAAAWLVWGAPALTIRIVRRCARVSWASIYFDLPALQAWLIIALILALYLGRREILNSLRRWDIRPYAVLLLTFAAVMVWVNAADRMNRDTVIRFRQSASSMTLKILSPEKRNFIIGDGLTNFEAQELLGKQYLPLRRVPLAAWLVLREPWMEQKFLESNASEGLAVFYLNNISRNQDRNTPEKLSAGFSFTADGVTLRLAAAYMNRYAWVTEADGFRILFPNGIPAERLFNKNGLFLQDIDLIVLGKRDDVLIWRQFSQNTGNTPALLDLSESGTTDLFISEKGIAYM